MGLKDGYQGPAVHAATVVPLPGLGAEELSEGLTARGEGSGGNSEIRALRRLQRESEPGRYVFMTERGAPVTRE